MTQPRTISLLVITAVCCFSAYLAATALVMWPVVPEMSGTEQFALAKHLLVLLGITVYLAVRPKIGSLFAAFWGVFVPFEKYGILLHELAAGTLQASKFFTTLDVVRLVLLLFGTCLSAIAAALIHLPSLKEARAGAKTDA